VRQANLEVEKDFTESRTAGEWLCHLYGEWRSRMKAAGYEMPSFEVFWASESLEIPVPEPRQVVLSAFRRDPEGSPLRTPSGKIYSQEGKIAGRESAAMNPADAAARGITDRSVVRLFNDCGSCLAGITLTEDVRPGVVQLSTGAWYDPDPADPSFCRHGNPNVLTADRPSSALSQGNTGQLTMVEIEPYAAVPPEIAVHRPPVTAEPVS
jgi:biotin/methionine sulfoxide reductase